MNSAALLDALALPDSSRVDHRVPKALLIQHGAPTSADKRRITDGIQELLWIAALKPTTVGVPAYRDEAREYLEIAVMSVEFRAGAKSRRLTELIHRAVPYPVVLIASQGKRLELSLAHKRRSQAEAGATVLDGDLVVSDLGLTLDAELLEAFRTSLALNRQPHAHMLALYQGWVDCVVALLAAKETGKFRLSHSPDESSERLTAMRKWNELGVTIGRLRVAAARERQMPRRVELNLQIRKLENQRTALRDRL